MQEHQLVTWQEPGSQRKILIKELPEDKEQTTKRTDNGTNTTRIWKVNQKHHISFRLLCSYL